MKKIAVFPGSFDPFTRAHQDLVERGLRLFDCIIVAVGANSAKKGLLSVEKRVEGIRKTFEGYAQVEVESYRGLTVDYCKVKGAGVILRGIRNSQDLIFEQAIASNNAELAGDIESVFLMSDKSLSHISSTIVRDIWINKGQVSHLVPAAVLEVLEIESQ